MKMDRKREIRRGMQQGHDPIKAVHVFHSMRKMASGGVSDNVDTIDPKTGAAPDSYMDVNPAFMKRGGVMPHGSVPGLKKGGK